MDTHTKEQRSRNMSRIRSKNTNPELKVRRFLWNRGFRYRLHKKDLPGNPDLFLKQYNTAVFVNGCFWHQHKNCKRSTMPKSNTSYWSLKLSNNIGRFKKQLEELEKLRIDTIVVWECQTTNEEDLKKALKALLFN